MSGPDISRNTFSRKKDYKGLLFQQKRPLLDAELNELQDIVETRLGDAVGASLVNGPLGGGFDFVIDGLNPAMITIRRGLYYHYGQPIRVWADTVYTLPGAEPVQQNWMVYLECHDCMVGPETDPNIQDPTLPGTAWRKKQVAEVKFYQGSILPLVDSGRYCIVLWEFLREAGVGSVDIANVWDRRFTWDVNYVLSGLEVTCDGLLASWTEGRVLLKGLEKVIPAGSLSISASSTRRLYVDRDGTVLSSEFPVLNRPLVLFSEVVMGESAANSVEDLRYFWSRKEFPEFENEYAERQYPFTLDASLEDIGGDKLPVGVFRDLRVWNGVYGAVYYVASVVVRPAGPNMTVLVHNTASSSEIEISIPFSLPISSNSVAIGYGMDGVTGESASVIVDLRTYEGMFTLHAGDFTLSFTSVSAPLISTLIQPRFSGPIPSYINNWRETNLARDYPVRGTSTFLQQHLWDCAINGVQDRLYSYYVSNIRLGYGEDFIEVSARSVTDATVHVVARLTQQEVGPFEETWVTTQQFGAWGEVVTISADLTGVATPFSGCYTWEEGELYACCGVPSLRTGPLCMGDGCIDVIVKGTSTGFGGTRPPVPILINPECLPQMVSVSYADIGDCASRCGWGVDSPGEADHCDYEHEYYNCVSWGCTDSVGCIELCPGEKSCGVWYLEYKQDTDDVKRLLRVSYGYVGIVCDGADIFRLDIRVKQYCPDCLQFEYTVVVPPGKYIESQVWDFGDMSTTSVLASPKHAFGGGGTYTVTLTVTFQDSSTLTETVQVVVP